MKIWIVNLESCVDGETFYEAIPCATKEVAMRVLKGEKETILKESHHWSNLTQEDFDECIEVEDTPTSFSLYDNTDSYYEYYTIEEKELVEEIW